MTEIPDRDHHRLHERARRLFRHQEQSLDAATLARLRAARAQAVALAEGRAGHRTGRPSWWLVPAAATVLVGALVLVSPGREVPELPPPAAQHALLDLELLLAGDNLALYEELDFFALMGELDEEPAAGSG